MRIVRNADVARRAGVSPATVSLVLNNRQDIAIPEETRERVRQAATKLGYRPNLLARNLLRGCTQTIGVIAPRMDSSFTGRILHGIQQQCQGADYHVLLAHTLHQSQIESRQIDLLLDHQVDGLIVITSERTLGELPQRVDRVIQKGVPCAIVDDRSLFRTVDCLVSDDVAGARLAVEHLLGLGHRRIAHLSGGTMASSARDRAEGYCGALKGAGLRVDLRLILGHSFNKADVESAVLSLLELKQRPTAVFAANDELAAEAWRTFRQKGLRVPEDVALVGYADYDLSSYLELTTIAQDAVAMGCRAAQQLLRRIAEPKLAPELVLTPTRLIVRQSCGASLRSKKDINQLEGK